MENKEQHHTFEQGKETRPYTRIASFKITTDDIVSLKERWSSIEADIANSSSNVGWSTAFFALILSTLLAIPSLTDYSKIWFVVLPFVFLTTISIILLIIAMIPSERIKRIKKASGYNTLHYFESFVKWKDYIESVKPYDYDFIIDLEHKFFNDTKNVQTIQDENGNDVQVTVFSINASMLDNGRSSIKHILKLKDDVNIKKNDYYDRFVKNPFVILRERFTLQAFEIEAHVERKTSLLKWAYQITFPPFLVYRSLLVLFSKDQFGVVKSSRDVKYKNLAEILNTEMLQFADDSSVFELEGYDNKSSTKGWSFKKWYINRVSSGKYNLEQKFMDNLEWGLLYIENLRQFTHYRFRNDHSIPKRNLLTLFFNNINKLEKEMSDEIRSLMNNVDKVGVKKMEEITKHFEEILSKD